jgi:hypothetical protein
LTRWRRISSLQLIELVAFAAIADVVAINLNKAFIDALQMVNGAQQRRFPEPDGPRITVTVPGGISSDTSSSALWRPKYLLTPVIEIWPL